MTPEEWFRQAVIAGDGRCAVCGHPDVEVHHIISQQVLRRYARSAGLDEAALRWDARNALLLCSERSPNRCHQRHTLAVKRVPRWVLPAGVHEFTDELGEWAKVRLEAEYPL